MPGTIFYNPRRPCCSLIAAELGSTDSSSRNQPDSKVILSRSSRANWFTKIGQRLNRKTSTLIPGLRTLALLAALGLVFPGNAGAVDLMTILEHALETDPQYREAYANALAAGEGIPQARADLWLPTLSFSGGTSRVKQDITLSSAVGMGGRSAFTNRNFRITLNQPVYHYDRYVRLGQADKRLRQSHYELDAARQALVVRVAERYFDVLAAQDNLEFTTAAKLSLQGQLEQARQRFEVGLVAITDVQEAQAGYDRATAAQIVAENELDNSREALREITAVYYESLATLGESIKLAAPDPADIEAWTETALDQNLEVAAAKIATEIAFEEIRLQYSGHLPTIDITGNHGFNKQGGRFGSSETTQSDIAIELNVPIYEGGQVVSRTREASHEHTAALEQLEQARRAVFRETRQAYLGVIARISEVKALRQAVLSSKTAVDSTRAGFEVGTRTAVDVVDAERGLFEARRDFSRSRYDYILDILRLKQAAGTLRPEDLSIANSWLVER